MGYKYCRVLHMSSFILNSELSYFYNGSYNYEVNFEACAVNLLWYLL